MAKEPWEEDIYDDGEETLKRTSKLNGIKADRCIACGLCQTYSELFDYHDNGIVKFASEQDDLLEKEVPVTNDVLEAIKECPTHALLKD